jgi:hypothetical protein
MDLDLKAIPKQAEDERTFLQGRQAKLESMSVTSALMGLEMVSGLLHDL